MRRSATPKYFVTQIEAPDYMHGGEPFLLKIHLNREVELAESPQEVRLTTNYVEKNPLAGFPMTVRVPTYEKGVVIVVDTIEKKPGEMKIYATCNGRSKSHKIIFTK